MKFLTAAYCLLLVTLSGPASAHEKARSIRHRHSGTPWTLRRDVDFFQIKSQQTQDGVLAYIFQNIGVTNKYYVEFGFNAQTFEGGSGANTYVLHKHFGWEGLLLDGQQDNPVEYNANFPLGASIACEPGSRTHEFDTAFGASLSAMNEAAREHGYSIVQVVCGLDVVLVRDDVLKGEPAPPLSYFEHCTGMSVHSPATEERKSELMDYNVWKTTGGDIAEAKKGAQRWMQENSGRI